METSNAMLQEGRNQVTSSSHSLHAQDKSIRRLKWAVAFCFILLATLVLFTVCLLQGGFALRCGFPDKTDKGQMDRQEGTRQIDASGRLHWESKRGLAFLTGGMIYSNKSIVIPKEGYYFVYSQLSFRPAGSTCADDTSISQSITRFNSNYPEPEIILSGISFCTKGSKIYQPISLGGLLHLKTGDQLKVDIRPVSPIDTSVNHKTFFGAFLV
ncbi:tumor necrosis factor ligand superfamily member 15 isoform X2 [Bufo bufo]|uniref:tumor necrosis factor ligand superfamily member 15 isoform X2 n=1 Tax=Bufo bufo TaxID=8384 RepID=UPI001ABEE479|nr:tumor necrosis factor ligand superfamily member 15 isoform X2 [Bufo bufo]